LQSVTVELGDRAYPIYIGDGLLGQPWQLADLLTPCIRARQVVIFSNATVFALYGAQLQAALGDYSVDVFNMPDGEQYKNLDTYAAAMDFLMDKRHNRTTCVIALGGGVVGDLSGFVAATFQRGVDFVQIPTTLLAQVDSSVGGKTAVNHAGGKNMIGAFYQPRAVVIDSDTLHGLAEVVKYGVIADAELFAWLEDNVDALNARRASSMAYVIKRCCEIKADVVAQDEREGGVRAILNFGHTFGHAIENLSGYGTWLHGEAVAVGMVMAARFSETLNLLAPGQAQRLQRLLQKLQLPVTLAGHVDAAAMLHAMGMDKKAMDGKLRFVVTTGFGAAQVTDNYDAEALQSVLAEFVA